MKRDSRELYVIILLAILSIGIVSAVEGSSNSAASAKTQAGASFAGISTGADASLSVESGEEVQFYMKSLNAERKQALLKVINNRLGLNLTLADLEGRTMRKAVRNEILEEIKKSRAEIMADAGEIKEEAKDLRRDAKILRAEVKALFLANISLYAHNLTIEERQEIIAKINNRYGLNLTVNDVINQNVRKEIREKIDDELRARLRELKEDERELRREVKKVRVITEIAKERGWINVSGRNIIVREIDSEKREMVAGKIKARFRANITADDTDNAAELKAALSNGKNALIKIMPDRASAVALARLKAKCVERNCSVELKEVGKGDSTRLAYEVKTDKESRVLFLFKKKMPVIAKVDAETGAILEAKKPWWAFLAREKNANETEIEADVGVSAAASASA